MMIVWGQQERDWWVWQAGKDEVQVVSVGQAFRSTGCQVVKVRRVKICCTPNLQIQRPMEGRRKGGRGKEV